MNKSEIRREVEKRASSYQTEELFSSREFNEMLEATITSVCEKLGRIPRVRSYYREDDNTTAYTDGELVTVNTASPLIRQMPTNWRKYVANIGHVVHEAGHVLFTDFANLNPMRQNWSQGEFKFYPSKPRNKRADEIKDYLNSHKMFRFIFVQEMADVVNIMEDVYIENRLYEEFDGLCTIGLHIVNDEKYRLSPSYNKLLDACLNGQILPISVAKAIMSIRKLGYEPMVSGDLTSEQQDLKDAIEDILKECDLELDKLAYERNGKDRAKLFNELLCKMFDLMPKFPDLNLPDMGQGEQDDYSEQDANNLNESSKKVGQNSGMSSDAKGNSSSVSSKEKADKEKINENRQKAESLSQSQESMKREFERAVKEMIESQVLKIDEQQHTEKLQREAKHIELEAIRNAKFPCMDKFRLVRNKDNFDKKQYQDIYARVAKTSINLSRKISNILRDREEESSESGFMMGQRFNAADIVHRDGKYFSRTNIPDGKLKVVFGLIIDESGSMNGRNRDRATETAILMEDCLRRLDIPLLVVGHNSHNNDCTIKSYVDFDTNDGNDKYRLAGIGASGCNCDGGVIKYVSEKLMKRPEQIKVIIVISDGSPTRISFFSNENPVTDTMLAIKEARRKGIRVFGSVVDDYENVREIYGKDFSFDCREDESLSKEFQKLIKKYCLLRG